MYVFTFRGIIFIYLGSILGIMYRSIYEEVKSRGANVITITDDINMFRENKILIPKNNNFSFLLSVIPFQYLAYYLSLNIGHNPDYPRNLAKVVTVE